MAESCFLDFLWGRKMKKFKLFSSILLVLVSAGDGWGAKLIPAVGDEVEYSLEWHYTDGSIQTGSLIYRLTSYDHVTKNFKWETVSNGHSISYDISAETLATNYYSATVITNCKQVSGTVEMVSVPAGTFQSCAYQYVTEGQQQKGWSGIVPFSLLKQVIHWPEGQWMTQKSTELDPSF